MGACGVALGAVGVGACGVALGALGAWVAAAALTTGGAIGALATGAAALFVGFARPSDVVDANHAWVVDRARELGFAQKPTLGFFVASQVRVHRTAWRARLVGCVLSVSAVCSP